MTQMPAPEATAMLCALLGPLPTGVRARAYFDDFQPEPGAVALWAEVEWDANGATSTARQPVATRQRWALAMGGDVAAAVRLMTDAVDRLRATVPALTAQRDPGREDEARCPTCLGVSRDCADCRRAWESANCTCRGVGTCPVHHVTTTVPMRTGRLDTETGTVTIDTTQPYPGPNGTTVHPPGSPLVKSMAGTFGLHEGHSVKVPILMNIDTWKIVSLNDAPTFVNDDGLTHVRTEKRVPSPGMFDAIRQQLTAPVVSETLQDLTRLRTLVAGIWAGCSECGGGEGKDKVLVISRRDDGEGEGRDDMTLKSELFDVPLGLEPPVKAHAVATPWLRVGEFGGYQRTRAMVTGRAASEHELRHVVRERADAVIDRVARGEVTDPSPLDDLQLHMTLALDRRDWLTGLPGNKTKACDDSVDRLPTYANACARMLAMGPTDKPAADAASTGGKSRWQCITCGQDLARDANGSPVRHKLGSCESPKSAGYLSGSTEAGATKVGVGVGVGYGPASLLPPPKRNPYVEHRVFALNNAAFDSDDESSTPESWPAATLNARARLAALRSEETQAREQAERLAAVLAEHGEPGTLKAEMTACAVCGAVSPHLDWSDARAAGWRHDTGADGEGVVTCSDECALSAGGVE